MLGAAGFNVTSNAMVTKMYRSMNTIKEGDVKDMLKSYNQIPTFVDQVRSDVVCRCETENENK